VSRQIETDISAYHVEILSALKEIGNPSLAKHMPEDRRSLLMYCGVRVPDRRRRVNAGFSFTGKSDGKVLEIWDQLWRNSDNGDVMFCALDHYRDRVRKSVDANWWPVMRNWIHRVENWAHADELSSIYCRFFAADIAALLPQIRAWIETDELWIRRVGLVSSIRYTGKNSVFLDEATAFDLLRPALGDDRYYIQKALGWVLRELRKAYPQKTVDYLLTHSADIGSIAFSRAIEHMSKEDIRKMRQSRTQALNKSG